MPLIRRESLVLHRKSSSALPIGGETEIEEIEATPQHPGGEPLENCKRSLITYTFPELTQDPQRVYDFIKDRLRIDGNSHQNLATFCTTWMEPQVEKLLAECADKNMINKDEYPETAAIEERCVHMLADLWNSPQAAITLGCSTTGSSEAAMLGGLALRQNWRHRQTSLGRPSSNPNLVMGPVQVCWHKFCRYFDVEIREVPMEGDRLQLSPEKVVELCDENTIGVVATLGLTFTLQYEPVKELAEALDQLEKDKGWNIPIHVDGASGAFIAPFIHPDVIWDFRLHRVKSINGSGHKFGLAPLGVGWALWRERADIPNDLLFYVNYLGGNFPTFALNFSRPGGEVICQYYNFLRLGKEGYKEILTECAELGEYLAEEIAKLGPFEIIYNGKGGIPGVCWKLKDPLKNLFNLYDFSEALRTKGWLVPAYSLPHAREDLVIQRALVRQGFKKEMAIELIEQMKDVLQNWTQNPIKDNLTKSNLCHDHSGRLAHCGTADSLN